MTEKQEKTLKENLPINEEQKKIEKEDDKSKKNKIKNKLSKINYKKGLPLLLFLLIGLVSGIYIGTDIGRSLPATHKSYNKSQVLATVGDEKITGDDFSKRMQPYFYYYGLKKLSNEEIENQEVTTINYMTNLEALYQAGKADGVTVTNDEVNEKYETNMSTIESKYNMTEEEYLEKFDLTEAYMKKNIKKEMIATEYLQDNSEVSEKEAKNYYNKNKDDYFEIRASHILISKYDSDGNELSDKEKEEKKALAEKILKRALKGESFEDLALENSDDSNTSSKGGDLGYFKEGQMAESFEKAAFSLEVDEIYPKVVETTYGYHIIKKTGEQYSDFDDIKDTLMDTLKDNKQSLVLQNALDEYNVKINM